MLIDTGAFITMMNKKTASRRGYPIIDVKGCAISGFSQQGLLCDLRKIQLVVFCGYTIKNVIVATPHYDNVEVSEVLGMNVLENFNFAVSLDNKEIFLNKRNTFVSEKPKYTSGEIGFFSEITGHHVL